LAEIEERLGGGAHVFARGRLACRVARNEQTHGDEREEQRFAHPHDVASLTSRAKPPV
jgi:hypothetical protein